MVTIDAVEFFRDHGGTCYSIGREDVATGTLRRALALADAEDYGKRAFWTVEWEIDQDPIWCDDVERETTYEQYMATLYDAAGFLLGSLGSVDFGPDSGPETDPYARIVAAELVLEAMHERGSV